MTQPMTPQERLDRLRERIRDMAEECRAKAAQCAAHGYVSASEAADAEADRLDDLLDDETE